MLISDSASLYGGWYDSHCHLNNLAEMPAKLNDAAHHEIARYLVPSTEARHWASVIKLQSPAIKFALGTHPWFVKDAINEASVLDDAVRRFKPSAIGEIGLDYYPTRIETVPKETQMMSFELQLDISQKYQLPVIVHCVKAHQELLVALKRQAVNSGVIHAFSGSYELATQYLELGFLIGIGPQILRSSKLQATVKKCPIENLVLETDAPYMALKKDSANPLLDLKLVGECVASLKQLRVSEVQKITRHNAEKLFR